MPASITIALVASSPKVMGRRMEMPASGPMPGRTPTRVPTRQPRNAYHSTLGASATEKPSQRLSKVTPTSETQYALFERRLERLAEQPIGHDGEPDRVCRRIVQRLALDDHQQHEYQQRHRDEEAERLVGGDRGAGDNHDHQCVLAVAPFNFGERLARGGTEHQREA